MVKTPWVHLRVQTEYSIGQSVVKSSALMAKAHAMDLPAVAVMDTMAVFGLVKLYKAASRFGIQLITGASLHTDQGEVGVMCQNRQGYLNLAGLLSQAYRHPHASGRPLVCWDWWRDDPSRASGLILLAGGGAHGMQKKLLGKPLSDPTVAILQRAFENRWYAEVQRVGNPGKEHDLDMVLDWAYKLDAPVVATHPVVFLEAEDFDAYKARIAIEGGYTVDHPDYPCAVTEGQYLCMPDHMASCFADLPDAVASSLDIAKRCALTHDFSAVHLPRCPIPEGTTENEHLVKLATEGLQKRRASDQLLTKDALSYADRLKQELSVIQQMGFSGYFLIVADFIRWAREHAISVGPGRGSGAGSLVAFALQITDLDPLAYGLIFERFLNPERVSMPDFDIDFCMEGRDKVIEYVTRTYGQHNVSQIITMGTMAAKAVVRDVGRVLGYPYGFVDPIAKLIPLKLGITLKDAMRQEPLLMQRYHAEPEVQSLLNLALKLEGLVRNVGKHAGGVVIAPSEITDFMPVYVEGDTVITQLDKDDVEAMGLVKFDFLGLRTLTIMDWAVKHIQHEVPGSEQLDLNLLPLDDPATYQMLCSGQSTAVFQLESRGIQELMVKLAPDCFEDIVALVALYRPGPLQSGMVDDFIQRKHGQSAISYPHPDLESVLQSTYGVILYQEQVMQIAQILAGYTLGQADLLRRAMGKKKPEEMAHQRVIFETGAMARGVARETAHTIFDLMEKFAGYGFNKSHSAAYAVLSYHTAWLKTHHPAHFMAAVLSADCDNTDKVVHLLRDVCAMGIKVLPPDVNVSKWHFMGIGKASIRYGLGAIKGVGRGLVEAMVAARGDRPFVSVFDFCQRLGATKLNKKALEALIASGAMDPLGSRAALMGVVAQALQYAAQSHEESQSGQGDLFDMLGVARQEPSLPQVAPWSFSVCLQGEKRHTGWYFSGDPLDPYNDLLNPLRLMLPSQVAKGAEEGPMRLLGLIQSVRIKPTQRGQAVMFVGLEDHGVLVDAMVLGDDIKRHRTNLQVGKLFFVSGRWRVDPRNQRARLILQECVPLDTWLVLKMQGICIRTQSLDGVVPDVRSCAAYLKACAKGRLWVRWEHQNTDISGAIAILGEQGVSLGPAQLNELHHLVHAQGGAVHAVLASPLGEPVEHVLGF